MPSVFLFLSPVCCQFRWVPKLFCFSSRHFLLYFCLFAFFLSISFVVGLVWVTNSPSAQRINQKLTSERGKPARKVKSMKFAVSSSSSNVILKFTSTSGGRGRLETLDTQISILLCVVLQSYKWVSGTDVVGTCVTFHLSAVEQAQVLFKQQTRRTRQSHRNHLCGYALWIHTNGTDYNGVNLFRTN